MRRPEEPERLYLDFDGFFASVEQAARPALRGRPVGVVPFDGAGERGIIIACSREAKLAGVANIMPVRDARRLCPDLVTVVQSPDLYRRAHNALIAEIGSVIPIDAVKSIDEMTCRLEPAQRADPLALGRRIKSRIRDEIGPWITCSIGHAGNRQLAKMACKAGKRPAPGCYGDGNCLWHPRDMPAPLLPIPLKDVPGIGESMARRLLRAGIVMMADLLALAPKQMRGLWNNVSGERLWYALHGYDVQTPPAGRSMYGHGRVLQPNLRRPAEAYPIARLLAVKAVRRLREDRWNASRLWLALALHETRWQATGWMPAVRDDQAVLECLAGLWRRAMAETRPRVIYQIHVALLDLSRQEERQLDILLDDDQARRRWEQATEAMDRLNHRYGRTVVSLGPWPARSKDYIGGKISYTRIPRAADFR